MERSSVLGAAASTADVFPDQNCRLSNSFSDMAQSFSQRVSELQQLVCFRVEDSVKHIFIRDIQGVEASVRALEQLFDDLKQRTQQEMASIPKARALLKAAELQQQHLQQISCNLPQHLPSACPPQAAAALQQQTGGAKQAPAAAAVLGVRAPAPGSTRDDGQSAAGSKAADKGRKVAGSSSRPAAAPATAPRWYITAAELASVPSYIKGRLTLDKVNAAIDEVAGLAEVNQKGMNSVARNQLSRVAAEQRVRLQEMYHGIAMKEAAKGRFWFVETDLKAGVAVKMDKTGKSMLMLLRHLGRLQEVRAVLEHLGSVTAYVLQPPT